MTLTLPADATIGVGVGGELARLVAVDLGRFPSGRYPRAIIRWGDGRRSVLPTSPRDAPDPGPHDQLIASAPAEGHVYRLAGRYNVRVEFRLRGRLLARAGAPLNVAAHTPGGLDLEAVAGETFSGTLGTFRSTYFEPLGPWVDWGDGSTSPATLELLPDGSYQAGGSHAYARTGRYTVVVWSAFGPTNPQIMAPVMAPIPVVVSVITVRPA